MTQGRRPSPEHLKLIQPKREEGEPIAKLPGDTGGTEQKEQKPRPASKVDVPAVLTRKVAKEEYQRVVSELTKLGKWHSVFKSTLAIYAQAYADWVEAEKELAKKGAGKVTTSPNGYQVQAAWLNIRNKAQDTMIRVANDFGLTLISQARLANVQLDLFDGEEKPQGKTGTDDVNPFAKV